MIWCKTLSIERYICFNLTDEELKCSLHDFYSSKKLYIFLHFLQFFAYKIVYKKLNKNNSMMLFVYFLFYTLHNTNENLNCAKIIILKYYNLLLKSN